MKTFRVAREGRLYPDEDAAQYAHLYAMGKLMDKYKKEYAAHYADQFEKLYKMHLAQWEAHQANPDESIMRHTEVTVERGL